MSCRSQISMLLVQWLWWSFMINSNVMVEDTHQHRGLAGCVEWKPRRHSHLCRQHRRPRRIFYVGLQYIPRRTSSSYNSQTCSRIAAKSVSASLSGVGAAIGIVALRRWMTALRYFTTVAYLVHRRDSTIATPRSQRVSGCMSDALRAVRRGHQCADEMSVVGGKVQRRALSPLK
ncbi:uncharacterized protein C8Q71DRAFT_247328 [Rhodofomes roseus]|uniref:Secreted protein n=1 Tax=Rhodofomes roseus TaxID=34475 RepID=A0ABQ8K7I1_9APHY|nr:uncharacterized protein C8Q71DRAFT_247328 [Rhodofomes roseus]KAH9833002.1 hypothetical protein C8Q71DRAFT_247328 [Rhodofomes roseus]